MLFVCVLNAWNFFHEKNKIKNRPDNLNIYTTVDLVFVLIWTKAGDYLNLRGRN